MATTIGMFGPELTLYSAAFESGLKKARSNTTSWAATTNRLIGQVDKKFTGLRGAINRIGKSLFSLRGLAAGAFAGWGLSRLAGEFIQIGSGMQDLELSLKTVTRDGGLAFETLNDWALKMPVTTEKAIDAYKNMRAMGLQPTIEQMTTLVDTTSALGGGSDVMLGIARALGQIQTKGKVATQELYQLAERGVPAMQILQDKLGLTAEQVANIGTLGIEGSKAVAALMEGMAERFGGMSEQMQTKFTGLWASIKSYFSEFIRLVMKSGVMEYLESKLASVVAWFDEMKRTGQLQAWAQQMANIIINLGQTIWNWIEEARVAFGNFEEAVTGAFNKIKRAIEVLQPTIEAFTKVFNFLWTIVRETVGGLGAAAGYLYGTAENLARTGINSPESGQGYQTGTGPGGLPRTGWFYGHQGEVVLNPKQSETYRRGGSGGGITVNLQPTFFSGDAAAARNAAAMIKRELDLLGARY